MGGGRRVCCECRTTPLANGKWERDLFLSFAHTPASRASARGVREEAKTRSRAMLSAARTAARRLPALHTHTLTHGRPLAPTTAAFSTTQPPSPSGHPPPALALTIHYCAACGYEPWVAAAATAAAATHVTVTSLPVPRTGAFEIFHTPSITTTTTTPGAPRPPSLLLWSKLETGQPVGVEGVAAVVEAALLEVRRRGGGGGV